MTEVEVPLATMQPDATRLIDTRRLQMGCWIALIAISVLRAWFTRYAFDGDSVSYLDIGRAIAEGHGGAAIHAYWSPGYPVLVSFFLWLFRPNSYWECPLVHFVNVLIFIGGLASFQLFWSEVRHWHNSYSKDLGAPIPENAFWALGYSVFAIATLNIIPVALVHPDLLVAAFVCLAGWAVLRFRCVPSMGHALVLGLVLAMGYYAKAPLFPMGFVFILCACFRWPLSRRMILLGGTAFAVFLLVSAPFIAALSRAKGRLTFGDSARLNYAFFIDGVQHYVLWQGGPPGSGMPVHLPRKLNDSPEIYEFAAENMGTYPIWFDPSYWYEGITPHTNWKLQPKIFVANVIMELQPIVESGAGLICAAIILALLANYRRQWAKGLRQLWFVWGPGAIALLMFAFVHVETRFLGGWLILLFAGTICACRLPEDSGTRRAAECVGFAVLILAGTTLVVQASLEAIGVENSAGRSSRNAVIADFLLNNGLHPGEQVAVIGDGMAAYWAHLARLHIVAEIPANIRWYRTHPAFDFWASGSGEQERSLKILARTGAEAVIADPRGFAMPGEEPSIVPAPWKKIDGTDAYVYFFKASQ